MYESSYGKPCPNGTERRSGLDRRKHSFITFVHALHGQRSLGRRYDDRLNAFVDRYEPHYLFVISSILVLCCLDALFTLALINSGIATEANPVMRWAMGESVHLFWFTKFASSSMALLILLALKNFYFIRLIKVSYLLYGTLVMYLLLIKYELWLFSLY